MCPHSAHLRRCNHHPPKAKHSTQPVPLGLAAGLMPSLSEFIYTAPMLIGWRNALIGGSSGAGKSSRRRRSSRPEQNSRGVRWISASGRSRLNASAQGASFRRGGSDGECRPQRCSGRLFAMSDKDFMHHVEHAHPKLFWHWCEPRRCL
jgi:hypothetical protein